MTMDRFMQVVGWIAVIGGIVLVATAIAKALVIVIQ